MNMTHWNFEETVKETCIEKECPECTSENNTILIMNTALDKIKTLISEYKDLEWGAGLIGRYENGTWIVEDIVVPEQEVGATTVELTDAGNIELAKTPNVIGWTHSHNTMNAFHSSMDDANCKMYNISVTVNNALEYHALVRKKLSCGKIAMVEGDVLIESQVNVDTGFVELIKSKIKKEIKVWKDNWKWDDSTNNPRLINFETDRTNTCHVCNNKYGKKGVTCSECGRVVHAKCIGYRNDTEQLCEDCCEDGWDTREVEMMSEIKYNEDLNTDNVFGSNDDLRRVFGTDAVLNRYC